MARIAINAAVDVAAYTAVPRIGCRGGMAPRALKDRIIAGIRVAGRTHALRVAVANRKPGVIERRSCPCRGGVAILTSRGEPGRRVVGVVRPLIIGLVTAITVGWETRIVVVYVTTRAGHAGMSPGKWKWSVVVIECALSPGDGVVAHLACRRKPELNVIHRRQSIVEVGLVASHAGRARNAVVVIYVARSASHADVCARQREAGRDVIECCASPRRGRVADGAVCGKRCRDMAWIVRALEIGLVAADTGCVG